MLGPKAGEDMRIIIIIIILITRMGCLSSQSCMLREYEFVIWWSSSISVRSKVIGIALSSTSVCVIDISKCSRSSLIRSYGIDGDIWG